MRLKFVRTPAGIVALLSAAIVGAQYLYLAASLPHDMGEYGGEEWALLRISWVAIPALSITSAWLVGEAGRAKTAVRLGAASGFLLGIPHLLNMIGMDNAVRNVHGEWMSSESSGMSLVLGAPFALVIGLVFGIGYGSLIWKFYGAGRRGVASSGPFGRPYPQPNLDVQGFVVDARKGVPIPRAAVRALWEMRLVDVRGSCVDEREEETIADEQGKFGIPGRSLAVPDDCQLELRIDIRHPSFTPRQIRVYAEGKYLKGMVDGDALRLVVSLDPIHLGGSMHSSGKSN